MFQNVTFKTFKKTLIFPTLNVIISNIKVKILKIHVQCQIFKTQFETLRHALFKY